MKAPYRTKAELLPLQFNYPQLIAEWQHIADQYKGEISDRFRRLIDQLGDRTDALLIAPETVSVRPEVVIEAAPSKPRSKTKAK